MTTSSLAAPVSPPSDNKKSRKQQLRDYGVAVLATAPASLATSVSRVPIKITEGNIETRLKDFADGKKQPSFSAAFKPAARRALGSVGAAAAIGTLTFPLYTKAMQQLSSDDAAERKKGVGLLVGQGLLFSAIKGGGEALGEAGKGGLPVAAKGFKGKMVATGLVGMPALYITSKAIADQRRSEQGKPKDESLQGIAKSVLRPALVAGGVSAAAGAVESISKHLWDVPKGQRVASTKKLFSKAGLKLVAPKAVAYGVAGIGGGVVSKLVVDKAIDALKGKEERFSALKQRASGLKAGATSKVAPSPAQP